MNVFKKLSKFQFLIGVGSLICGVGLFNIEPADSININLKTGFFSINTAISETSSPIITNCRDSFYRVDGACELKGLVLTNKASEASGCVGNGMLNWTVFVDLWADGVDDYEFSSFLPVGNDVVNAQNGNISEIKDDNGNGIKDVYVAPTSNNDSISITIPETIIGKFSNHKVTWKVTDECQNSSTCQNEFKVEDKKAPTPICVPLSSAFIQDPILPLVEILAIELMNRANDNCTPEGDLTYTFENVKMQVENIKINNRDVNWDVPHYFNKNGGQAAYPARETNIAEKAIRDKYQRGEDGLQLWNPVTRSSTKVWTADDFATGFYVDVKVTVWDKRFNSDFCWTTLICIDCFYLPHYTPISGTVSTFNNQKVQNVTVSLDANIVEFPKAVLTSSEGFYKFDNLPKQIDYEISASKDGDDLNGVSTLDLVMIQKHILGLDAFTSPYQLIAADANNDGKVTVADLTELRKLILGISDGLPNNQSWRFPIADQSLTVNNAFPFVEQIKIKNLSQDLIDQNFVAVKIGDVNGNASTNFLSPTIEIFSEQMIKMLYDEKKFDEGEVVEIPIIVEKFKNVYGFQFTIDLEGLDVEKIYSDVLDINQNNIGIHPNGKITMSYSSDKMVNVIENKILFTIVAKANKSGFLSEVLNLNSSLTHSEAYVGNNLQVAQNSLSVNPNPKGKDEIQLFQNEPNPFRNQTSIFYIMPYEADVTLNIFDSVGRLIKTRKLHVNKGLNLEVFTANEIGSKGILFYTLESDRYTSTKKMILID